VTVRSGSPNAGQRFEVLDSLRGVCATMVVLYHLRTPGFIANSPLVFRSSRFVDFFFVLSGFVIAASYGDRLSRGFSIRKFMALRLGRVYPLHIFMLAVFLLFELTFASGILGKADRVPFNAEYSIPSLIENAFLVQTFLGPDGATLSVAGDDGSPDRIRLRHCPFLELAEPHRDLVCPIHLGLMQGALSELRAPVTVTALIPFAETTACLAHLTPGPDPDPDPDPSPS